MSCQLSFASVKRIGYVASYVFNSKYKSANTMNVLGAVILLFAAIVSESRAYFITVDAHAEECFFDRVEAGTKMGRFSGLNVHTQFSLSMWFVSWCCCKLQV